jgi:hypothetical protein
MLNSSNLHTGLELGWGETTIDTDLTTTPQNSKQPQQQIKEATIVDKSVKPSEVTMNKSFYEQESWILQLPSAFSICLNRYKYDSATQSSSKILEPFEFYPFIYLDR